VSSDRPRILIVRLSALGDIVHALPVLSALRRLHPSAAIDWLVEEAYAPILGFAPGLTHRVVVRARALHDDEQTRSFTGAWGYARAVAHLRRQGYDIAIDLQGLLKSATWARLSGARRVVGFARAHLREPQAALFYSETVPQPATARHVIQKNLAVAEALGASSTPVEMALSPAASPAVAAAIAQAGGPRRYVVINPGAAWPNKRWPPDRFGALAAAVAERTGLDALVTWGPAERELADAVCRASSGHARPAPATSVGDLAVLVRDAAVMVSGDTGPLHIAAAMGTPVVGLYGPTFPDRNGPWDPADEVISRAAACECHHKRRCLRGRPCIDDITLAEVVASVDRRLARAGGSA